MALFSWFDVKNRNSSVNSLVDSQPNFASFQAKSNWPTAHIETLSIKKSKHVDHTRKIELMR